MEALNIICWNTCWKNFETEREKNSKMLQVLRQDGRRLTMRKCKCRSLRIFQKTSNENKKRFLKIKFFQTIAILEFNNVEWTHERVDQKIIEITLGKRVSTTCVRSMQHNRFCKIKKRRNAKHGDFTRIHKRCFTTIGRGDVLRCRIGRLLPPSSVRLECDAVRTLPPTRNENEKVPLFSPLILL